MTRVTIQYTLNLPTTVEMTFSLSEDAVEELRVHGVLQVNPVRAERTMSQSPPDTDLGVYADEYELEEIGRRVAKELGIEVPSE